MARTRQGPRTYFPSWRYAPDGVGQIFNSEEEVPPGWSRKPGDLIVKLPKKATEVLDGAALADALTKLNIDIKPTWGHAHMKRILDGDVSSDW